MEQSDILSEIASLPPEAQKQAIDFIAFLKTRYPSTMPLKKAKRTQLADEPFIGMWRTRSDMKDSAAWVKSMRQNEWERRV